MNAIGNTFKHGTISGLGHARKVWREIRNQYPSGGVIGDITGWIAFGKIPAGTPVKFDMSNKSIVAYTDSALVTASGDSDPAAALAALGINGLLQEDVYLEGAQNQDDVIPTGTVVYDGEIYEYMLDSDTVAALKSINTIPMIVFVQ